MAETDPREARVWESGWQGHADAQRARLPEDVSDSLVVIADPMLATGGSAAQALTLVKSKGASELAFVCIVAAPEGVAEQRFSSTDVRRMVLAGEVEAAALRRAPVVRLADRLAGEVP